MKELFEILASLVKPFFGAVGASLSGQFGWRPLVALGVQIILQAATIFIFFGTLSVGALVTTSLLVILGHSVCAFLVFAIGIGLAFEMDKKRSGKAPGKYDYWLRYAETGYAVSAVVAVILTVPVLFIAAQFAHATWASTFIVLALSVGAGAFIDVTRVLWPVYMASRKQDKDNRNNGTN